MIRRLVASVTPLSLYNNIHDNRAHTTTLSADTIRQFALSTRGRATLSYPQFYQSWYVILQISLPQRRGIKNKLYARLTAALMASLSSIHQRLHQFLSHKALPASEIVWGALQDQQWSHLMAVLCECDDDGEHQKALTALTHAKFDANYLVRECSCGGGFVVDKPQFTPIPAEK